jgi:uncharacterized phage protein (TIGR01671 family)
MREIKFRAWNKKNCTMLKDTDNNYWKFIFYGDGSGSVENRDTSLDFNDVIIQRYTGLKDFKGKDVYEGDVIKLDDSQIGGSKVTGEVIFNNDQCLSNLEWGLWLSNGYHSTDFLGTLEVIGNIHENPELLKS